jgi:O-antigen/teichoic acid export membrane protein
MKDSGVPGISADSKEPASLSAPVATEKHLVGGIAWTAAARWSSQILTWASLLVVARLLRPSDFGLVGMAAVYLGLLNIFSEFGFGSALITLRDLAPSDIPRINTYCVISGVVGFVISCALAKPLGWFFRSEQLPIVVVVMSAAFLIAGFKTVPYSLLQKELRFKLLSVIDTATAVTQSVCTLLLAWGGAGYWALVIGNVAAVAVSTALNVAWRPTGFAAPAIRAIRHAITFSWQVLVARLSWSFYSDADFLVAGRVLGSTALGAYTFAWNLALLPVEKVTTLVGRVTPAFFSAKQTELGELKRYFRNLTEAVALATFPAGIGLGLVAPDLVPVFLGKGWEGVIAPLQVLAYFGALRSVSAMMGPLLTAIRETRFMMWNNVIAAILMPICFYIGSRWGPVGVAYGWIVGYPVVAIPRYRRAFNKIGMSVAEYLGAIRPALGGSVALIAALIAAKLLFPLSWRPVTRLSLEIPLGAAAYLLFLFAVHADRLRSFLNLYRRLRSQDSPVAAG